MASSSGTLQICIVGCIELIYIEQAYVISIYLVLLVDPGPKLELAQLHSEGKFLEIGFTCALGVYGDDVHEFAVVLHHSHLENHILVSMSKY